MTNQIFVEYCPSCLRENYSMAVSAGECAWCGYRATKKDIGKKGVWEYVKDKV